MVLEEGITAFATYNVDNAINDIIFKVFTKFILAGAAAFGAVIVRQARQFLIIISAILGVWGVINLIGMLFKLTSGFF